MESRTFYVSLTGNDSWSGGGPEPDAAGQDGPFATLERARDAIRALKSDGGLEVPVTVQVRGGVFRLAESFMLTAEDSGTEACPVVYRAYAGEQPVLSGARRLTDWTTYRGKVVRCDLPEVRRGSWNFRQLFCDGRRQIRSRYPKHDPKDPLYGGWAFVAEPIDRTTFRYEANTFPRDWANPHLGEVNIFPWLCWNNDIVPIQAVDRDRCTIHLARPLIHRLNQANPKLDFMSVRAGNRFFVENLLEELDQPGEWCLDRETGTLYFWPPGDSPEAAEVTAPVLSRLIELRGSTGAPVRHITISGLTLTQTLSVFPQPQILSHNHPNSGGHAVYMEGTEQCAVEACVFDAVGGDAIRLQDYNAHARLTGNDIADPGAQGICVVGAEQELPAWANWKNVDLFRDLSRERPRSVCNNISHNRIRGCGQIEKRGSGVYVYGVNCVDNVISHNRICDTAHRGIMLTHGFGRNIVEYNDLARMGLETADTGGINTLLWYVVEGDEDLCHGNVIRFNRVRDVVGCGAYDRPQQPVEGTREADRIWTPYYGFGIYLDWNPMNVTVYGNIVVGYGLAGIMMLGDAKDNLIENNIFVGGRQAQIHYFALKPEAAGNRFVRNIVYYPGSEALLVRIGREPSRQAVSESDHNLFCAGEGKDLMIDMPDVEPDRSFDRWREFGYDAHSLVADPLFLDPEAGDYRLNPDSPAIGLGFKPIDTDQIGPAC